MQFTLAFCSNLNHLRENPLDSCRGTQLQRGREMEMMDLGTRTDAAAWSNISGWARFSFLLLISTDLTPKPLPLRKWADVPYVQCACVTEGGFPPRWRDAQLIWKLCPDGDAATQRRPLAAVLKEPRWSFSHFRSSSCPKTNAPRMNAVLWWNQNNELSVKKQNEKTRGERRCDSEKMCF